MTQPKSIRTEVEEIIFNNSSDFGEINKASIKLATDQILEKFKKLVEGKKKKGDVALGWGELTQQEWGYNEALTDLLIELNQ